MAFTAASYERFVAVQLRVRCNNLFYISRILKYMLSIWVPNVSLAVLQWAKSSHVERGTHHGSLVNLPFCSRNNSSVCVDHCGKKSSTGPKIRRNFPKCTEGKRS